MQQRSAQQASLQTNDEPQSPRVRIGSWLLSMVPKIMTTRDGYDITPELQRWTAYLLACDFTENQAARAELWITRGDWSYKGKGARLEGSDFFPSDAKLKDILGETMVLLSRA
ncbi:MAG: hypothetical protein JNL32_03695, partial [Candidatus Kapabacteria bacterium]|nr:hypothetical protein [Candidatus Kapabacteria bacterium]